MIKDYSLWQSKERPSCIIQVKDFSVAAVSWRYHETSGPEYYGANSTRSGFYGLYPKTLLLKEFFCIKQPREVVEDPEYEELLI